MKRFAFAITVAFFVAVRVTELKQQIQERSRRVELCFKDRVQRRQQRLLEREILVVTRRAAFATGSGRIGRLVISVVICHVSPQESSVRFPQILKRKLKPLLGKKVQLIRNQNYNF